MTFREMYAKKAADRKIFGKVVKTSDCLSRDRSTGTWHKSERIEIQFCILQLGNLSIA
jgi:hypothetical protein